MNIKEDLLNEIVRLSAIPKHPLANGTDQPGVSPEKCGKSAFFSSGNHATSASSGGCTGDAGTRAVTEEFVTASGDIGNEGNLAVNEELNANHQSRATKGAAHK